MLERIEINAAGVRALLQDPAVLADLKARAQRIAEKAGGEPDFEVESQIGATRARASVRTATFEGRRAEAKDRTLTQAIDAGRG
jgi:hypothetical protein